MNAPAMHVAGVSLTREMLLALRYASKTITDFILDGLALPPDLEPLGTLILAFTCGTAASTALHYFIRRNREHRARIDLAIFLVARMVETSPHYRGLLDRPENLLHILDDQFMPVLDAHLNKGEAKTAMARFKRKVYDDAEESCAVPSKRRRGSAPDRIMAGGNAIVDSDVQHMALSSLEPAPSGVVDTVVALAVSEANIQAQLLAEWRQDESSVKDSIENQLGEQQTLSGHLTESHAANSSQGSPTTQSALASSQEPLPESNTTSSNEQTPVVLSMPNQSASQSYLTMPPPPFLGRRGSSSVSSHRTEAGRRLLSPTPASRRIPRPLSNGNVIRKYLRVIYRVFSAGRAQSNATVQPPTATNGSARNIKNLGARIQLALDNDSAWSIRMPRTTTHEVTEDQPVRGGEINQAQPSDEAFHHGTSEDPPNTIPAQTVASVKTPKKKLGRPKKYVTKAMLLARRAQDEAVALGTDHSQEASGDVFTTASAQASAKAPKKKRGPYKKKVPPSSTLTTPLRGLTASGGQVSHETAAEPSTAISAHTSVEAPKKKGGRLKKHVTQASTPTTPADGLATSVHDPVTVVVKSKRRGRPPKTPVLAAPGQEQTTPTTDATQEHPSYLWVDESKSLGLRT